MEIRYCTIGVCIIDHDALVPQILLGSLLIRLRLLAEHKHLFVVSDMRHTDDLPFFKNAHSLSARKRSGCANNACISLL